MDTSRITRRANAAAPWAGLESVIQALIGVLSLLIVVRLLGPEAYGRASLAIVVVSLIEAALTGGLHESIVRSRSIHGQMLDTLFWTRLGLGALAFIISGVVALNITWFFEEPELPYLVGVYGATCIINALSELPAALLTRKFRGPALAKCALVSRSVIFFSSVILAVAGAGSWSLIISSLLGLSLQCVMLWSYIPRRPRFQYNSKQVKAVVGFGLLVSTETLLSAVVNRLFMALFGYLHGVEALGYLNFAIRLVDELAMVLTRIAAKFAYPLFAALDRGGRSISEAFLRANRIMAYGSFPMFAGVGLVAPEFIRLFFGFEWEPSILMVQILAAYWVLASSRLLVGPLFRAIGRPSALLYLAASDAALSILAVLIGASLGPLITTEIWGARAVIIVPLTAFMLAQIGETKIRDQLVSYAPAFLATLCMLVPIGIVKALDADYVGAWLALLLQVTLGALTYTAALLALDRQIASVVWAKVSRLRSAQTGD
jgi:PST family polysaccharide transporter